MALEDLPLRGSDTSSEEDVQQPISYETPPDIVMLCLSGKCPEVYASEVGAATR